MKRTLFSETKPFVTLPFATRASDTTVNGTTVDRAESKNYFRLAYALITTGAITDGTQTLTLQVSDDNSAWSTAPAQFTQGTNPVVVGSTDDDKVYEIGYTGPERYLRVSVTVDVQALGSGGAVGAVILMHGARRTPV